MNWVTGPVNRVLVRGGNPLKSVAKMRTSITMFSSVYNLSKKKKESRQAVPTIGAGKEGKKLVQIDSRERLKTLMITKERPLNGKQPKKQESMGGGGKRGTVGMSGRREKQRRDSFEFSSNIGQRRREELISLRGGKRFGGDSKLKSTKVALDFRSSTEQRIKVSGERGRREGEGSGGGEKPRQKRRQGEKSPAEGGARACYCALSIGMNERA